MSHSRYALLVGLSVLPFPALAGDRGGGDTAYHIYYDAGLTPAQQRARANPAPGSLVPTGNQLQAVAPGRANTPPTRRPPARRSAR